MSALPGHPHRLSGMSHRPTPLANSPNQKTTPKNSQTSVTVTHEDLRWVLTAITTPLGGLHSRQGVTNVPAEYT